MDQVHDAAAQVNLFLTGDQQSDELQQSDEYLREWAMEWRIAPLRALPVSARRADVACPR